jgi:hypothetical protein
MHVGTHYVIIPQIRKNFDMSTFVVVVVVVAAAVVVVVAAAAAAVVAAVTTGPWQRKGSGGKPHSFIKF